MTIGSRKMTPPRMLRIVPFGERYMRLRPNSSTRASSGRDRRALDADAVLLDGVGRVDGDLVVGLVALLDAEVEVLQVDVEVREDQLVLDERPDDPRHLVPVELDDGVFTSILAMRRSEAIAPVGHAPCDTMGGDVRPPRFPPAGPPVRHPHRRRLLVAAGPVPGDLLLPGQVPRHRRRVDDAPSTSPRSAPRSCSSPRSSSTRWATRSSRGARGSTSRASTCSCSAA